MAINFNRMRKKIGKTLSQTFNPFSSDFDSKKALMALGTLGGSAAAEVGLEASGEVLKQTGTEIGRGLGNFGQDVKAGLDLSGLTGNSPLKSEGNTEKKVSEAIDPRRRLKKGKTGTENFGTLTNNEGTPSLIG